MMYEAESGDFNLIAVGDTMITQRLSIYREDRYLALVDLIRGADASFSNLEMTFHDYEVAPGLATSPAYSASHPDRLEEYKWLGFNLVTMAHNHHNDYGIDGLLTSLNHIARAGLVHAGAGHNLSEARAPAYLETPKGRVALLACVSRFVEAGAATHQRPDHKGRAGINPLRHRVIYTIDDTAFEQMRRISTGIGLEDIKAFQRRWVALGSVAAETESEIEFLGKRFRLGKDFDVTSVPDERDMGEILKWVREARRQADWVLMSIHCHEEDRYPEPPPAFLETFARRCVDEGVDAFLGHGPHFTRGVEIYNGKPIFYGLGNFVFQNETYKWAPHDTYEAHGLGHNETTADAWDARTLKGTTSFYSDPKYWHGLVAQPIFEGWELKKVLLHIVDQGYGQPRSRNGRPVLASHEVATKALERLVALSKPYGTVIEIQDGIGTIRT